MGRELGAVSLLGRGAGSLSNKMLPDRAYPHAKFHLDSSIQPFGHNTRTSQTGQTGRQADRQRSDSVGQTVFGRPFVKRFALCYRTVVYLSVCPVCLWRWCIVAKRFDGTRWNLACRGLGPGQIVFEWDPLHKGAQPPPNFRPMSIVAKRLDGSRCHLLQRLRGRPRPRRHCIRWGPSSVSPKRGTPGTAPNFRPMSIGAKRLYAPGYHLVPR